MQLSEREFAELTALARLALSDEEAARLRGDLGAVLTAMQALAAVPTTDVPAMTHPVDNQRALRADVASPSLPVSAAVTAAPLVRDHLFVVPISIEGDE